MAIRPSFQFYPDTWVSNSKLKRCSHELKGIWIDILCLLHDSDEYGMLRWPLEELAQAVGATPSKVKKLVSYGILMGGAKDTIVPEFTHTTKEGKEETLIKSQQGPLWFSPRQVRDEHFRQKRGKHGTKSSYNENVPKKKVSKDTIERSPSSSSPSSSSPSPSTSSKTPPAPKGGDGSLREESAKTPTGLLPVGTLVSSISKRFVKNWEYEKDNGENFKGLTIAICDQIGPNAPKQIILAYILAAKDKENQIGYLIKVFGSPDYSPGDKMMVNAKKILREWGEL